MAYPHPTRYGYSHPHNETDASTELPPYFASPEASLLEPVLLNADMMQPPSARQWRKGPSVNTGDMADPNEHHHWTARYTAGTGSTGVTSTGPSPYHDDHQPMPPPFGHPSQPQAWPFEPGSGDCTPTSHMDFEHPPAVPSHVEHVHYMHQRNDSARGSFSQAIPRPTFNAPPEESFVSAQPVQAPMSPHSHQDWMIMAAQESESKPNRARIRAQSPPVPTVDFQRRDGIRKKNARIDIPHERSIATIESLLETTTDEELLKELKQQKRLLRNREAALASRQRKKRHTEDLEAKEKDFNRSIESYIQQTESLQHAKDHFEHHYHKVCQQLAEFQRAHELLEQEKHEMKRMHDGETAILRKRIHVLEDELQHGLAPAMSAAPSSTGFADFNAEMESLSMGVYDWGDLIAGSDLPGDLLHDSLDLEIKPEPSPLPTPVERPSIPFASIMAPSRPSTESTTSDQAVTSGLLFFLLLCGAFVASKPPSSQPSDLPQVPADVRAAAPIVLNNLLSDTQALIAPASIRPAQNVDDTEPTASILPRAIDSVSRSRLDRMHQRLTAPTRQQQLDSAFALTAQEYASIANLDYIGPASRLQNEQTPTRPRRTIAEALQSAQDHSSHGVGKSEVDLRSLLMQQIPEDVVKQFRALVRDHEEIEARQQRDQDHDDMTEFQPEF